MSLSISSSRLWLSIATSLLLVLLYNFLVSGQAGAITHYQNQWVKNYSTVERFLYATATPDTVIVGSSMAARLDAPEIGGAAYNLSLASTGALTGLSIIEQSGKLPAVILVESNILEKERDPELLESLFTPVLWRTKEHVPALQYTYQPINFLVSRVYKLKNHEAGEEDEEKLNKTVFERELARRTRKSKSDYSSDLENTPVFNELAAIVGRLERSGSRVVLFDAPNDPRVASTPRYRTRQSLVEQRLPGVSWLRLNPEQHAMYQTSDGVHLLPGSARAFSRHLGEMLRQM